jgi:anion-transporting  ArsA/GET3 family ATPase
MDDPARLVIFCGKGGVGKTTLSLAEGLRHAMQGRKALVVSSHPLSELALSVSLSSLPARFPAAAPNLYVVYIDPKELIAEVVKKYFPMSAMAQKILESSIFTNLIEIAPGLKEFFFLGKLQELAEERRYTSDGAVTQYDYILWDAPASGHFLSTIRSGKSFHSFLTGPLANAGAQLHRFFSNSSRIQLFPVTPLEEMAIAETLEIAQAMQSDFQIPCAAVLINSVSPMCVANENQIAELEQTRDSSPALRFSVDRGMTERARLAELRASLPAPQVLIPRITQPADDLDLLAKIGASLDLGGFA